MTSFDLLDIVKAGLGITGTAQDKTLTIYINEALAYMEQAGVDINNLEAEKYGGIVVRGVNDLWNLNGGETKLSPYFKERVTQLVLRKGGIHNGANKQQ